MSLRVQDRLILDDGPAPAPRPAPQPPVVVPVAPSRSWFTATNLKHFAPWVAMGLMAGVLTWQLWKGRPAPGPTPPPAPVVDFDPAFVPLGKQYAAALQADFAKAAGNGATLLESGQARTMAYDTIAKEFKSNREASFDAVLTPALNGVSSTGSDDKVTDAERKALARAWRGIQKGATP